MSSFILKVEFEGDVRRFRDWTLDSELPMETVFQSMQEAVRSLFQLGDASVLLKYRDPEGDVCSLTPYTLHDLLATASEQKASTLKLIVYKRPTADASPRARAESAISDASAPSTSNSRTVGDSPELVYISSPPTSDDEWTIEGELSNEDRNRPFFDLVRASVREACERGAGDDASFQQWLREFHSESSDVWFSQNYIRLFNAFRPVWDEVAASLGIANAQDGLQASSPESVPTMSSSECSKRAQFKAAFEQLNSHIIQPARRDLQRPASSIQEMSHNSSRAAAADAPKPPATSTLTSHAETSVEDDNRMAASTQSPAVPAQASDIDATALSHLVTGHRGGADAAAMATVESTGRPLAELICEERGHGIALGPSRHTVVCEPVALGLRESQVVWGEPPNPVQAVHASAEGGVSVAHTVSIGRGTRVLFQHLHHDTNLNGQEGVCQEFVSATGRWNVRLQNGEMRAFRPEHLFVLPAPGAQGSSHEPSDSAGAPDSPDTSINFLESMNRGLRKFESSLQDSLDELHTAFAPLGSAVQQHLHSVEQRADELGSALQQRLDALQTAHVPQCRSGDQVQRDTTASVSTDVDASAEADLNSARSEYAPAVPDPAGELVAETPASPRTALDSVHVDNAAEVHVGTASDTPLHDDPEFIQKASQLADMMESDDYVASRELLLKHSGDLTAAIAELWPDN